jgi:hypothetical protein
VAGALSQPPASRVSASRSTRPLAESPVWASSPTSSTIDAANSPLLGGCTGRPISIASSASKPWLGTVGSGLGERGRAVAPALARRGEAAADRGCGAVEGCDGVDGLGAVEGLGWARGLGVRAGGVWAARLGFTEARSARAAAVCRARALRALGRWGRVLGRLDNTPGSSGAPVAGRVAPVAGCFAPVACRAAPVAADVAPACRPPPDRLSLLVGLMGVRNHRASGLGHTGWARAGVNMGLRGLAWGRSRPHIEGGQAWLAVSLWSPRLAYSPPGTKSLSKETETDVSSRTAGAR